MIRGIYCDGVFRPIDPLPEGFENGTPVTIEFSQHDGAIRSATDAARIDEWYRALEALGPDRFDEQDWQSFEAAVLCADNQAKAWVRREMGLSC